MIPNNTIHYLLHPGNWLNTHLTQSFLKIAYLISNSPRQRAIPPVIIAASSSAFLASQPHGLVGRLLSETSRSLPASSSSSGSSQASAPTSVVLTAAPSGAAAIRSLTERCHYAEQLVSHLQVELQVLRRHSNTHSDRSYDQLLTERDRLNDSLLRCQVTHPSSPPCCNYHDHQHMYVI
jgi:hypothetical protein